MGELDGVAVDEFSVVCGVILSRRLVFGKVPTGGDFGLQSLITKQEVGLVFSLIVSCGRGHSVPLCSTSHSDQ